MLARADLAWLAARSRLEMPADLERGRAAVDRVPPEPAAPGKSEAGVGQRWPQGRVLTILAALSLAANGVLLAIVVAGGRTNEPAPKPPVALAKATPLPTASVAPSVAARSSPMQRSTHEPKAQATAHSTQRPTPPATASPPSIEVSAAIERRILALVVQSPSGKLPPTLVDQKTGLAKNNLQAVCRSAPSNSLLCVVRPARHRPGEGLSVRYRPSRDGRGSFVWYPYRSG